MQKYAPEVQKQLPEKVFLKISQTSQENTCVGVFFYEVFKKETPTRLLSCEVCETFKNTYFEENLRRAASENVFMKLRKI